MPLLFTVVLALREKTGFFQSEYKFSFNNFVKIFRDPNFQIGLGNTLLYTFFSVPLTLFFSLTISLLIAGTVKKWARGFWQTVFFLPYVTNSAAISLAFVYLFYPNGIFNWMFGLKIDWLRQGLTASDQVVGTRWTTFFVSTFSGIWTNMAFQILILTTAILGIEPNLFKAAAVDGASKTKQLFALTIPLIRKQIIFLITFGIISSLRFFPLALFENSPTRAILSRGPTLMILLFLYTSRGNFAFASATTVVLFIIGIFITFFIRVVFQKTFTLRQELKIQKQSSLSARFLALRQNPKSMSWSFFMKKPTLLQVKNYLWMLIGLASFMSMLLLVILAGGLL